jgi:predicted transposase/invertase (TIGR01784 family)
MLSVEDKSGKKRKIYFLFEHKSFKSDLVYVDFIRYVALAYRKHLSHESVLAGPILPILLIQTEKPWDPPNLTELLQLDKEEKENWEIFLPFLKIQVINLHRGILEKLEYRKFLHFMLYVMHFIREKDLESLVDFALQRGAKVLFDESAKGIDRYGIFLHYIIQGSRHLRKEVMAHVLEKNLSESKALEFMTFAERERFEGRLEGIEQGIEKGMEKKAFEDARLMKAKGYSMEDILEITGLSEPQLKENGII